MSAPLRIISMWRDDTPLSASGLAALLAETATRAGAAPATPWVEISVEPVPDQPGVSAHTFECKANRTEVAA